MVGTTDISKAQSSNMENWTKTAVVPQETDGINETEETTYTNDQWSKQWGYFNQYPDLKLT